MGSRGVAHARWLDLGGADGGCHPKRFGPGHPDGQRDRRQKWSAVQPELTALGPDDDPHFAALHAVDDDLFCANHHRFIAFTPSAWYGANATQHRLGGIGLVFDVFHHVACV